MLNSFLISIIHRIKSFFCLLPFLTFGQVNDTVLPQIEFEDYPLDFENKTVKFNLEWADTIIKKTHQIYLVQLRPSCDDGKKRKTIPPNSKRKKIDCYPSSVIQIVYTKNPWKDSVFGFDRSRMFKWKKLKAADYFQTINVALGKRVSENSIVQVCYEPRHAIVFLDSMNQIIGIHEICFMCAKSQIAFRDVEYVNLFTDDFLYLKRLFVKYGYKDLTSKISRRTRRIRVKHFA